MPAEEDRFTLFKAISHPVRLRVLESMNRGHTTPKAVAEDLGETVATVSYHVRTLHDLGCIELVETREKRGAKQHVYRPIARGADVGDTRWAELPLTARETWSATTVEAIVDRAGGALRAGTMEARTDRHLSFVDLRLDESGWREIASRLNALLDRAMELQSKAAGLDADEAIESTLALMHFERAPDDD